MGRAKSAAVTVACIVIGLGVARAGLAHAPAEAPAPAAVGNGGVGYDIAALVVVGLVVMVTIGLFYRHKQRELLGTEADLDGFTRRRSFALRELWECPVCQSLMRLDAVPGHKDPDYSLCAFFSAWLDEHEGTPIREFIRAFSPNWQSASNVSNNGGEANGGVRISATMAPDHSVTTGEYDTLSQIGQGN